jgi:hypothetical protein
MVLDLYNSHISENLCKSLQNKELTKMTPGPIIKSSRADGGQPDIHSEQEKLKKNFKRRSVCREKTRQWDSSVSIRIHSRLSSV